MYVALAFKVGRQLYACGFTVIFGARNEQNGQDAVAALDGRDRVVVVSLDIANDASVTRAEAFTRDRFGHFDVLINNAAIVYDSNAHGIDVDLRNVHTALETNLFGAWRMIRRFLPLLRQGEHSRVVNVSSEGGSLASMGAGTPAYSVSKAALNALTRIVAAELAGAHILVNAICPGWTATDMGGGGRPVSEGAASIVWGALLPDDGPSGGFFRDGRALQW